MTSKQLIEEGRKLQRPCVFLRDKGFGPIAAVWYEQDDKELETTGHHCWLTVDTRCIPGLPPSVTGYISIFTNVETLQGGHVEITPTWPNRPGIRLYSHNTSVLPPIDAVFARGSESVGQWIESNSWKRNWRYNDNFKGKEVVLEYDQVNKREFPLYYESDIFAVLGGWHWPCDDDWHRLIDEHLMVLTVHDSEPWVEAWHTQTGHFKVIQRST
jgi:hypothetical protein